MRWSWIAIVLVGVASCRSARDRDREVADAAVRRADAAVAAIPVDARRAPERVADDAGWSDTQSAASMVQAGHDPPPKPARAEELTFETPFPHGDAHDAPVVVARGDDPADLVARLLDGAGVA